MNTNPTVILNGDQIYIDELIRENARLTIQHEADKIALQSLEQLRDEKATLVTSEAYLRKMVFEGENSAKETEAKLRQAISDLHFVMAGGDPCKVCAVKCAFGEGHCKPVWQGEEASR